VAALRASGDRVLCRFPPGPLAIGDAYAIELTKLELEIGKLVLIAPTECVKDRLAWYFHTGDNQSLLHALLVARDQSVDLAAIRKWSEGEGKLNEFEKFLSKLHQDE
jgi:hypothetical protein